MKIAVIVPGGVDRSGQYRVIPALLALLGRLAARHEVHVFALAQERAPGSWMLHGARIHNIGGTGRVLRHARAIREVLRENRAAPFDIVHSIWASGCGLVAVSAAKLLRIPGIVHVAGGELIALPQIGYGGRSTWQGRMCEALVLRGATAVTAASAPILAQIAALGRTAHRIPLGVDLSTWPARAPVRRDMQAPVQLIHIASLNQVKDQTTLLRSLAALGAAGKEFFLDIVGEDTLGGKIQALAQQLGLAQKVSFHGFLTQRQLRPLLERAHINLVSSLHEAGPLVVLESAALGVPTVGTAVGHIAEWAPNAALAVPVGNSTELASAIGRLIDDEDLRLKIAVEAMRRAVSEDADDTFARFDTLYAELTSH